MKKLSNILVYEWQAWDGFLISHLVEAHCRLEAVYDDVPEKFRDLAWERYDAVLFQINISDASEFPRNKKQIVELFKRKGLRILNAAIDDITKSHLHRILEEAGIPSARATQEGDPDEMLFIKSNNNYGGEIEHKFLADIGDVARNGCADNVFDRHDQYYVATRGRVAPELWQDKSVVIEKYISNPENSFYRFYRFGAAAVVVKGHSTALIKKICGHAQDLNVCLAIEDLAQGTHLLPRGLPELLARFIHHTGMEYFCLDLVHDMQSFYIIDLNLTPHSGNEEEAESEGAYFLRSGMSNFFDEHSVDEQTLDTHCGV